MMGEADEDFRALLKPLFAAMAADLELLALLHDREISKEQTDILADYRFSEGLGLQLNHEKASLVIKSLDECLEQLITADGSGLLMSWLVTMPRFILITPIEPRRWSRCG